MRYSALACGLFLMSFPAYAQVAGDPCQHFGQTMIAADKTSVLACLRPTLGDPSSPLVWMLNATAPRAWKAGGDTGSEPFYTIGPAQKAR